MKKSITIEGKLDRITYYNQENHYTVARIKPFKSQNRITVIGHMAAVQAGETLRIEGVWETHPRFGQQLRIETYSVLLPASTEGIRRFEIMIAGRSAARRGDQ